MKKKFFAIAMLAVMALMGSLTSCGTSHTDMYDDCLFYNVNGTIHVRIFVDPETKVNYLIYTSAYQGGITVRVDANGKPIVGNPEE